ncbi:COG1470 family protein [Thermus scotoductus]|uniref:COG1470 family protein n=1 Tax=Thermus scotoductus TaxID=37636 RepID=UPI001C12A108|nr:choice-of-anchor U domain-containing protein [Thermus scotoductus]
MVGIKRLWPLAGLALLLAACGGGAPPQDLTLSGVSPNSPSVAQGGSVTLTLTFTSQNGFQGTVSLSVTKDGQEPSWLTLSPASKSLNVPKGGQAQETLQLQVAGNAPTGPHALKLRATYGDKTAERDLTLTVNPPPSFALSLNPTSLSVQQGDSAQTALTLTPQNGFTGTVSLSLVAGQDGVPQGLSLSPQSVQVTGSSPVNQTLTLSASASTPTGTYRLKVRGTSGSLTQEAALTVTVSAPSGGGGGGGSSGSAGGVQVNLQGGTFTQGPTAQNVPPPQGFQAPYGAIAFTAQVPQGGTLTVTLTFPNPIPQGAVLKKYQGNAWQDVPGAQLSGNTATYQVQDGGPLDGDGQQNGQVVDPVALLTPAPSYTLSDPSPNPVSVTQGSTATFQVTLTSQNGFQGEVPLSLADGQDPVPQGLSIASTDPSPISLFPNASVQVTVTLSADAQLAPGTYRLTLRAQGGSVVQEKPLTVQVVQPPVEVHPSLLEVQMSNSGHYGFLSGSVTFRLFVRPPSNLSNYVLLEVRGPNGESVGGLSLNPGSVYVDPQRENTYTITLSVTSGGAQENVAKFWVPGDNPLRLRLKAGQTVEEVPITLRVVASPPGLVWSGRYMSDWGVKASPFPIAADSQGNVFGMLLHLTANTTYAPYIPYILGLAPDGRVLTKFPLEGITIPGNYPVEARKAVALDSQGNIYALVATTVSGRNVLITQVATYPLDLKK